MSRALPLVLSTLVLSTLLLAACTQAASPPPRRGLTSRPTQPPRPRLKVRPRVLPIPEDYGVIRVNLTRLWTNDIYRKYRPRISSYVAGRIRTIPGASTFASRCGLNVERDLQTVTFPVDLRKGPEPMILVFRIRTDASRLLRCFTKHAAPQSTYKPFRYGPLQGVARYKQGILQDEVLVLDNHRLVWMGRRSRLAVREVLTGKRRSVASTQLYRSVRSSQPVAPLVLAVLPTIAKRPRKHTIPMMNDLMAAGLAADLPLGGLKLRGLVVFGKKESAAILLRMKPALAGALSRSAPALVPVMNGLRLTLDSSDPAVVRLHLDLTAVQLNPLIALLEKLLTGLSQKKPPAKKLPPARP